MADKTDSKTDAVAAERAKAPFGYDLVGEDGRRIHHGIPYTEAVDERGRIASATGEKLEITPTEAPEGAAPPAAPASPDAKPARLP
jgi:hypothetical protein